MHQVTIDMANVTNVGAQFWVKRKERGKFLLSLGM